MYSSSSMSAALCLCVVKKSFSIPSDMTRNETAFPLTITQCRIKNKQSIINLSYSTEKGKQRKGNPVYMEDVSQTVICLLFTTDHLRSLKLVYVTKMTLMTLSIYHA